MNEFPHHLYDFRLDAETAGFLDKYHSDEAPHWMDDDCYIKLGSFNQQLKNLSEIEEHVREYLRGIEPITVDIKTDDISIFLYDDPSLRHGAIKDRVLLSDAIKNERSIVQLYHQLLK